MLAFSGPIEGWLLGFLVFSVALAALTFYLGYILPWHVFQHKSQAGFLICIVLFIPGSMVAMWAQTTAPARLAKLGIDVSPNLGAPDGIAVGWLGKAWMFHVNGPPETILDFYRQ